MDNSLNEAYIKLSNGLYSLKLLQFEEFFIDHTKHYVKRVPGGWIFYNNNCTSMVFVPYSDEFKL
jgi:hypothetical protein